MAAHWKIRRAKYPADPSRPWMAIPGKSIMRAHRFATFEEARKFVAGKRSRRTKDKQK